MTYVTFKPGYRQEAMYGQRTNDYYPPADIVENENSFALEFDVPGFKKDDIKVSVKEGVLSVTGERKRAVGDDEKYYRYFERPEGEFNRSFKLPDHVNGDSITAAYTNGVLRLELPKKEEAKPHTIEIK